MGKGDKRSRKGKIFSGSYGKTRPKPKKTSATAAAAAPTRTPPAAAAPEKRTPKVRKKAEQAAE